LKGGTGASGPPFNCGPGGGRPGTRNAAAGGLERGREADLRARRDRQAAARGGWGRPKQSTGEERHGQS